MGLSQLFYPWGFVLQALALVHFVRRRPDGYWLWIILMFGALGAVVYFIAEVIPDFSLIQAGFVRSGRRRRLAELEAIVQENAAVGNLEELADLCLEQGQFARARELYDKVIASPQTTTIDPYYRRGLAAPVQLSGPCCASSPGSKSHRRAYPGSRPRRGGYPISLVSLLEPRDPSAQIWGT